MDEDYYSDTRHAALHVCHHVLRIAAEDLTYEQRRHMYPEITKRLDDPSDAIREMTGAVLRVLVERSGPRFDETNAGYMVKGILIHMDDANPAVAESVLSGELPAPCCRVPSATWGIDAGRETRARCTGIQELQWGGVVVACACCWARWTNEAFTSVHGFDASPRPLRVLQPCVRRPGCGLGQCGRRWRRSGSASGPG